MRAFQICRDDVVVAEVIFVPGWLQEYYWRLWERVLYNKNELILTFILYNTGAGDMKYVSAGLDLTSSLQETGEVLFSAGALVWQSGVLCAPPMFDVFWAKHVQKGDTVRVVRVLGKEDKEVNRFSPLKEWDLIWFESMK